MTPILDHNPPLSTRAERRTRNFWRCVWTLTAILFVLTAWDFTYSVLDHFDRVEQANRASTIQKVQR